MKKTITISVDVPEISVPQHLQKPISVDFQIKGFTELEAIELLMGAANNMFSQYKKVIDEATQKIKDGGTFQSPLTRT